MAYIDKDGFPCAGKRKKKPLTVNKLSDDVYRSIRWLNNKITRLKTLCIVLFVLQIIITCILIAISK